MPRKKETDKKKRITIKDINQKLEDEIKNRREITEAFSTQFEKIETRISKDTDGYKKSKEFIEYRIEELKKMKSEVTSYTLQLVSIIVGIFALILTISYFAFNKSILNNISWLIRINGIFVFVLIIWFIVWLFKEDIFSWKLIKRRDIEMTNQLDYRDRKYLLLGIIIGGLLGFIGNFVWSSYYWTKEYQTDEWMFWFGLIAFIAVIIFGLYMINLLDKKSRTS